MESKEKAQQVDRLELPSKLQELLPCGYSYKLKNWTPFDNKPNHFEAVVLTNVYTEEEAQEWWHAFNAKSNTTMRVRATCPKTGKVNTFKIYLRCLHQGRAEKTEKLKQRSKVKMSIPAKRNTNCPAGMIIAIRRLIKYSRSKMRDPVDPYHPCEIQIRYIHNHSTNDTDSLRFRPVSKESEQKLLNLFQKGHSPSSALETLKIDLQIEHGSQYNQVVSDRYYCPDKSFCYRLYYKHFGKDYPASSLRDIDTLLIAKISHYNSVLGDTCLAMDLSGKDHAIAICTPLMKRGHMLSQSGDMVYIDICESSGNKERTDHYILLLVAHTSVGGVPLGCILTTGNSIEVFELGFQLLKQVLPKKAFYGRNGAGPHSFSIPDSENLRVSLTSQWPDSDITVCIFRILQTMWQWLWEEKHHVLNDYRIYLLYLVKTLLFASNESEMESNYQALCTDNITLHYPQYLEQLENIWQKRHLWGICFHRLLPLQGASNYYEAAVRALKDKLLEYTKLFNIVQVLNFLVTRIDLFYKTKFLNILQEKSIHIFHCHFPIIIPPHIINNIQQIAGNYFSVPGEVVDDKIYTTDAELNTCSCAVGIVGALCVHQYWVFLKMPTDMFKVGFLTADFKQKLFSVATGSALPVFAQDLVLSEVISVESNPNVSNETVSTASSQSLFPESLTPDEIEILPPGDNLPNFSINSCLDTANQSVECDSVTARESTPQTIKPSFQNSSTKVVSVEEPNNLIFSNSRISAAINPSDDILMHSSDNAATIILKDSCEEKQNDDTNERIAMVLDKFEKFYQRVKDGLKDNTKEYLPALEIMMKNIERKGNTSELLVSGLSFFGVLSAPSLLSKGKKRPCAITSEEIIPKVHGRQMITYGKKRPNPQSHLNKTPEPKLCSDVVAVTTLRELTFTASENR